MIRTCFSGVASGPTIVRSLFAAGLVALASVSVLPIQAQDAAGGAVIKVGIIGLDTSHAIAFTSELNAEKPAEGLEGFRVVAAYPQGSKDIESSTSRVPGYIKDVEKMGVEIVPSIDDLLKKVDVVLLESNDGRPHLEQLLPVLKANKRVFIDKPVAGSLADAVAIYRASEKYKVPLFSSSSLRFMGGIKELREGKLGKVQGCDTYGPCSLEKTHPDLFWYGIHGCEALVAVMGPECESAKRTATDGFDFVVGRWSGNRIGTFRGIRVGAAPYGGMVFGEKGAEALGAYGGYRPLVKSIAHYFRTGETPVSPQETLALYAFMEAADESKRQGGVEVKLADVMKKAEEEATKRLAELDR